MATLQRYDGTSVDYSDADLDSIIAHLAAANVSGTGTGDNVHFMAAAPSLLIMDLNWQINRRFSELFQASNNVNQLFNLQFENDQDYYNLPQALVKCGYAGVLPQNASDLPSVYMVLYDSGLVGADKLINVGTGDSLVAFGGTIAEPGQIKGLQAGPGIFLTDTGMDINIEAQPPLFSSLGAGVSILDSATTPTHIFLNTLQGGAGISLLKTGGAVRISSAAILNSTGTGTSLVQGAPGAIQSLLGGPGVVVTSDSQTVTVSLGSRLTANSFYVTSDSIPIPSGSIFTVTQNQVIANTAQLATTSLQSGNNATAITALQTTQGTQGTSITALQTTQGTQGTSIATLQTSQGVQDTNISYLQTLTTLHTAEIAANYNSQMDFNTQLGVINTTIAGLSASSGSGPLPYYANDSAARAAGLKQYAMYRTGPTAFTMRQTADVQYMYSFDGGGALDVPVGLGNNTWTIQWWAYIPQLRHLTMVQIASISTSVTFGLSGGGAYNCIVQGSSNWSGTLVNPPTNTWCQYGAQCNSSGLISYWILPTSGGSFQMGTLSTGSALTTALGNVQFTAGMNYTSDYGFHGVMSSILLSGNAVYANPATSITQQYPFVPDSACIVNLSGNPIKNASFPSQTVGVMGNGCTISAMNFPIGTYVV